MYEGPFSLTLSSFKQSIQNLIHISEKCLKTFLLFFVNSMKITDVNCILRIILKMNDILNNLIGFLDSKRQSCHPIETCQLICRLTGFYMMATLTFNELIYALLGNNK